MQVTFQYLSQSYIFNNPPSQWIAKKIERAIQAPLDYLLNLSVFQLGRMNHFYDRWFLKLSQKCLFGGDYLNLNRLEASTELLKKIGGVEKSVTTADGAEVHYMVLSSKTFFEKIVELGGEIREDGERRIIVGQAEKDTKELFEFLSKFSLPQIVVDGARQCLLPLAPKIKEGATPFVLRSHSPGRSMVMDRKFVGRHLGAGYDICIWDPRGTIHSKGFPSEGGYYTDLEAVINTVKSVAQGEFYLSGYCLGAAINVSALHKHDVHFIAENPFDRLVDIVEKESFIGRWFGRKAIPSLYTTDASVKCDQTGFDLVEQLNKITTASEKKFIVISTDTDHFVPEQTIVNLQKVVATKRKFIHIQRIHPDKKSNGHMQPPTEDDTVWKEYIKIVV